VARIKRTAAGTLQLDPQFIRAARYFRSEFLIASPAAHGDPFAKSSILAEDGGSEAPAWRFYGADIASFWLLLHRQQPPSCAAPFPRDGKSASEKLYRVLSALGGSLTTFSLKIQPRACRRTITRS